jgi:small GTP-binding protein
MMDEDTTKNVKVNVVGSGGTGKTRYIITVGSELHSQGHKIDNLTQWTEDLVSTVGGYLFNIHDFSITDSGTYDFAIWDLGGQLRYSDVRKVYLEDTSGILAVIDLSRGFSLDVLLQAMLKKEVEKVCDEKIPIVLVGNKSDLREAIRENKDKIAHVIANSVQTIIEEKKTTYEVNIRIGSNKGKKKYEGTVETLGERPALRVSDFEASVYFALESIFPEEENGPFTRMNLKLLTRELWFVITNSLFADMMGENIPYSLVERANLGVPLFREYMRSPDVLVPIDFDKDQLKEFLEEILVSKERLMQLADELTENNFNVVATAEVSSIKKENVMEPFMILLKEATEFLQIQTLKKGKGETTDLKESFDDFET